MDFVIASKHTDSRQMSASLNGFIAYLYNAPSIISPVDRISGFGSYLDDAWIVMIDQGGVQGLMKGYMIGWEACGDHRL